MRATRLIKFKRLLPFDEGAYSIITTGLETVLLAPKDSPIFPGCRTVFAVETLPRGTEFLDAETGG